MNQIISLFLSWNPKYCKEIEDNFVQEVPVIVEIMNL